MNIKVALTNLGAYNEGRLEFEWLTLPYDVEDLKTTLENIGIDGVEYEEYFISDYEAPFEIGEYESLTKLNEIAEEIELIEFPERGVGCSVEDVVSLAQSLESEGLIRDSIHYVGDIIEDEHLDDLVAHEAQEYGWQRVKFLLGGIERINEDYYRINGYGNIENIEPDYLDAIMSDLLDEMKRNL